MLIALIDHHNRSVVPVPPTPEPVPTVGLREAIYVGSVDALSHEESLITGWGFTVLGRQTTTTGVRYVVYGSLLAVTRAQNYRDDAYSHSYFYRALPGMELSEFSILDNWPDGGCGVGRKRAAYS